MKLLINDKEIAYFLSGLIDYRSLINQIEMNETHTAEALGWALEKKGEDAFVPRKFSEKTIEKITRGVRRDLEEFVKKLKYLLKNKREQDFHLIYKNIDFLIEKLGTDRILKLYKQSPSQNFVKSLGLKIDKRATLVRRNRFSDYSEDCVLRNTVGNENFLINKIDQGLPFWFIDSGYTNFIEPNKRWHRIVRNHLHYGKYFDAPADRMVNFPCFPRPWRNGGEIIMVIEPGKFSANIFHTDVTQWKKDVEKEIRQFSDKKIVFREKSPKKQRPSLYRELLNEDYFCMININSNAATEAVWTGVPIITLDRHITNAVARSKISDINDLYRGPLGNWLAFLSYCQFTYDELIDGSAYRIVRQYHE